MVKCHTPRCRGFNHTPENCWVLHPEKKPKQNQGKGINDNKFDKKKFTGNVPSQTNDDDEIIAMVDVVLHECELLVQETFAKSGNKLPPEDFKSPISMVATRGDSSSKSEECIFDSNASLHMFNDKAWFNKYQSVDYKVASVGLPNLLKIEGCRSLMLKTSHDEKLRGMKLTNVAHCPTARYNIVSMRQLSEKIFLRRNGL